MLSKILYTDSGSGQTQTMLKFLLDLPAVQQASLTILHVVSPQVTAEGVAQKWQAGSDLISEIVQELTLDPAKITTVLRQGEPKDVVCQVADEIDADLIVMGSRGLKRLEAILSNSVSQYVFQLTNHPMLLVKDDIYVKRLKRVMVALDKSQAAQYSFKLACHLLKDNANCELLLARVNPDLDPKLLPLPKAEVDKNPILAPLAEQAKRLGIKTRLLVSGGKPGEVLCRLAAENNVDLLILGSPERRPSVARSLPDLDRLLGSSLSDYVRVNADCPVLLARREEATV